MSTTKESFLNIIARLKAMLGERDASIVQLQSKIHSLEAKVADLLDQLNKNSRNSSKPPSSDGLSKPPAPVSLRPKGSKPSGGQVGHKGTTLEPTSHPDYVIRHKLHACPDCEAHLEPVQDPWIMC